MTSLNITLRSSTLVSYSNIVDFFGVHSYNAVDAKLKLFGSSANEFGSRRSDIDISMRLPGHYDVHEVWLLLYVLIGDLIMCYLYNYITLMYMI